MKKDFLLVFIMQILTTYRNVIKVNNSQSEIAKIRQDSK